MMINLKRIQENQKRIILIINILTIVTMTIQMKMKNKIKN